MVLSDKEFLAPNKAILHTKPKKLSWVNVVHAGHQKTSSFLAMSTNNSTIQLHGVGIGQPDTNAEMSPSNLNAQATRPFLKGSVPNSIFVDITTVKDKKIFLTELTAFCQGNEHLWAVADQIRREYQRLYAEITVSPAMYERLCTESLQLPSFTDRFHAFPSLSPSAELLKVTLTGLPHQYGRRDGGLAQLHSDMQRNLSSFGHIIDSGTIRGTSGIYSGKDYVVLEKFPESDQQRTETPRPELQHNVHWVYQPLAYSTSATSASLLDDVSINVHATWSSMKPYCRYCHGDHPLKDCRNVYGASGAPNKKTRKTPIASTTEKSLISSTDSVTSLDKNLAVSDEVNVETTSPLDVTPTTVQEASGSPTALKQPGSEKSKYARVLRSATNKMLTSEDSTYTNNSTIPVVPAVKVCQHCKKEGHVRKQHRDCEFYVPYQTKLSGKSLPSNEDTEMMGYPDPSVHTTSNGLANKDDMSIDTQGGIASEHLVAPYIRNHFIRYLRTRSLDILALQETHASTIPLQETSHLQFQATDSLWTPHCGLICFSPLLSFSDTRFSVCGRVITTLVSHTQDAFEPIYITVIYAPVTRRDRFVFLDTLAQNRTPLLPDVSSRHLVLGDFNYTYATHISSAVPRQAPPSWLSYIDHLFQDCVSDKDSAPQVTFSRGTSRSCIDYIFGTLDLYDCKMSSNVSFIQPSWSDHFLVTSYFALRAPVHSTVLGKGQWRAHPRLASSETFRNLVSSTIANTMVSFDISLTPQEKWGMVKSAITQVAKSFSRRSAFNLTKAESLLHRKRARITKRLASNPELLSSLTPQLSIVESQLASLQQYHAETLALRAGIRWREQGEISAGYLKRTVSQRQTRQIMKQLVHPTTTGALCSTSNEMLDAAVQFYTSLTMI
ncbi:hypothetical protein G6F68_009287 [Rhizopus microsporus]|nr:hypothetical protein G6F68_009287 [Rhizopus microsporus]